MLMTKEGAEGSPIVFVPNPRTLWIHFTSNLFHGAIAIFPLAISIYVSYLLLSAVESFFSGLLLHTGLIQIYFPGMGTVATVFLIYGIGVAAKPWLGRKFLEAGENAFLKIPVLKSVYGFSKDLMLQVTASRLDGTRQAVLVNLGDGLGQVIGIVTSSNPTLALASGTENTSEDNSKIMVYVPMSYQIGGFTLLVPRNRLTPIGLSVQEAMKVCFTAGISSPKTTLVAD